LQKLVESEGVGADKAALELVALSSGGSVRDAESLLGQALILAQTSEKAKLSVEDIRGLLGVVETQSIGQFVDLLAEKNTAKAIAALNEVADKGYDLQEYGKSLINYLRHGLILGISGTTGTNDGELVTGLTDEEFEKLKIQTTALGTQKLQKIIELFLAAQDKIKYSPIPQLPMELAIISSCAI
jgi:DNA polymerase-3 subunit gamma/tau